MTGVVNEEVRQQLSPGRDRISVKIRDPSLDQNLFIEKEVPVHFRLSHEDGMGLGYDLGVAATGNRFVVAQKILHRGGGDRDYRP